MAAEFLEIQLIVWDAKNVKWVVAEFMVIALLAMGLLIFELAKGIDLLSPDDEQYPAEPHNYIQKGNNPHSMEPVQMEHNNQYEIGGMNQQPNPYGDNDENQFDYDKKDSDENPYQPYNPDDNKIVGESYKSENSVVSPVVAKMTLREDLFMQI